MLTDRANGAAAAYGPRPSRGKVNTAALKARVTVEMVLAAHQLPAARRGPCPIHGGNNRTAFTHDGRRWHCFTRCGTGDVVRLVELLRGVGFRDAVRWFEKSTGRPADHAARRPREAFPDIAPSARAAWLAHIDERWNALRQVDPTSPAMDDLEAEWREARRMPGAVSIQPLLDEVVRILRGDP